MKMSCTASASDMTLANSTETRPSSTALARTRSRSMPAPSSRISMFTWPPSWPAVRRSTPSVGLPAARRLSGVSMPWSTVLRTMWVRGSLMASMRLLSSSVSLPSISRRTCLPSWWARSRTTRGSLPHTVPMGCMRVFITRSCSSEVIRLSRWADTAKAPSGFTPTSCMTSLRASTSSPTRVIRSSRRSTSTRMVESAALRPLPCRSALPGRSALPCWSRAAASSASPTSPWPMRISPIGRWSPNCCSAAAISTAVRLVSPASTSRSPTRPPSSDSMAGRARSSSASGSGWAASSGPEAVPSLRAVPSDSGRPSARATSRASRSAHSTPSSCWVDSITSRKRRMRSTVASRASVMAVVRLRLPSRSRLSRFSALWAKPSRWWKPRKPHVPLMVCMTRKIEPSTTESPGFSSRSTNDSSSVSSSSWLSTRNS